MAGWTSAGQAGPWDERHFASAAGGQRPAITMQPTLRGEAGDPIGIVVAEIVCHVSDENDLFAGLAAFVRAEMPAEKASTDRALDRLLGELRRKGRRLGADAILSTTIRMVRGSDAGGHKLLKMIGTGTAVLLPAGRDASATP
jgi:uncharacterized protein YbjQ (UPF0145 family)